MNEDHQPMPKRVLSGLIYVWRLAIPFWIFRDAGRGSVEQRIANYRYNRSQRKVLPFYMWKWVGIAVCMLQLTQTLSIMASIATAESADRLCATLFCMSAGIGFAFSCVVILLLSTSYLFLTCVKR